MTRQTGIDDDVTACTLTDCLSGVLMKNNCKKTQQFKTTFKDDITQQQNEQVA